VSARAVAIERGGRAGRAGAVAALAAFAFLATFPAWAPSDVMRLGVEFACLLALAQAWNLLAGYGGMVSLGQQAFIGIGGYTLFALANGLHVNAFLCVPAAGVVCALAAVPISRVVFRLHGGYFAVGTWVVAEIVRLLFANWSALGGGSGQSLTALVGFERSTREALTFWLALALVAASTGGVWWLLRSRLGLALTAIRDGDAVAESQGVDVARTKFVVYVAAAAACGVAGALYFLSALRISPDAAAGMGWIPLLFFAVIVGGIGTIEGPIVGTALYLALRQGLGDYGAWYLIADGAIAIVIMLVAPRGLFGLVAERFGMHLFPVRSIVRLPTPERIEP
jgi:branched-chain amino acid transport system permease protein